jgi:DNA invertase Pin-like site-specific DNA recombinase
LPDRAKNDDSSQSYRHYAPLVKWLSPARRDASQHCSAQQHVPVCSLADFGKLVELFDEHGVSFVSVTQSFNTTSRAWAG